MTELFGRRRVIRDLCGRVAAAGCAGSRLWGYSWIEAGQERNGSRAEMFRIARAFMEKHSVPGMGVSITRNGKFVYEHSFGMADRNNAQQVQPNSLFRIASVTKPITAVTIFTLIEQGKLNLNDKVFGPSGILGIKYGKPPYKQYVTDVTVDNLLTHTSGGWPNDSTDPMFQHDSWDHQKLITWTLENLPLTYPPGQHWAYSNFGYCLLGRVIEQVTGQPYAAYVQSAILGPCGLTDMQIARNKEGERYPNEVVYYGQYSEDPYKMNVTRMDSHGGWIASSNDLVVFLDHVTGFPGIPSLLKPETIKIMTTPSPAYPAGSPGKYARGWMVRSDGAGNWWHTGSLPGTTTIMVRTATGMRWAALTNTRTEPSDEINGALDEMVWDMVRQVPAWNLVQEVE
jgi:CubicO group peptidase (beta-lactamase class C family)